MTKGANNSDMRTETLRRRYLWKDKHGKVIETEEQMYRRVAVTVAAVESKYGATKEEIQHIADEFFEWMITGVFLPNSFSLVFNIALSTSTSGV